MQVSIEPWRRVEPPDNEYPQCGACDEYGRPIMCWQCIYDGHCALQSVDMEDESDEDY